MNMKVFGLLKLNMMLLVIVALINLNIVSGFAHDIHGLGDQPLSRIAIHKAVVSLHSNASITASSLGVSPSLLGTQGEDTEWVTVDLTYPEPSGNDWFQFVSYHYPDYTKTGKATLKFQLINQRADFSFALFTRGIGNVNTGALSVVLISVILSLLKHTHPKLVAISNSITFVNPKAPLYPRIAQGKSWDEMTVTWTSGYDIHEATPFVEWGLQGKTQVQSPAGTLTFAQNSMCGAPARTVGWRDPGFIHTSFLKNLWPNQVYTYRLGHLLSDGSFIWSKMFSFKSSPYPGQDSLQRVIVFGDMGKYPQDISNYQGIAKKPSVLDMNVGQVMAHNGGYEPV
ncbi:probable inactive purple acid phosphatase 27 [Gastrolobium bilobum]|uniref:probable inactive purple acid phosphatase 27 n=1 Tax=Gastrolobium bilobum TaxID=150636 RepID=UPI002AB09946|nr:probable inactive purple acid phosphatase 27 [Gastrolobium bilobum]